MPPTVKTKPSPIPAGQTSTCTRWYQTTSDDICDDVINAFGVFSKADFIAWNPSVGSSCVLTTDTYYCAAVPGTPTTRTSAVSTTAPPTQTPTQSGLASSCTKLWLVSRYAPTFFFPYGPHGRSLMKSPLQVRHVCVDSRRERHHRNTTLYLEPGYWQLELYWPQTRLLRLCGRRRVFWQWQHHQLWSNNKRDRLIFNRDPWCFHNYICWRDSEHALARTGMWMLVSDMKLLPELTQDSGWYGGRL